MTEKTKLFIDKVINNPLNDGLDYLVLGEYVNSKTPIKMKHILCGNEFMKVPEQFLRKKNPTRCPHCSKNKKLTFEEFKRRTKNSEYILLSSEYINNKTPVEFLHIKCNRIFKITPNNFLAGYGCSHCAKNRKTNKAFLEEVNSITNEYVFLENYINNSIPIKVKHITCNSEYYVRPADFLYGNRCPICKQSSGANIIFNYLKDNFSIVEREKEFDELKDVKKLKFDFYIPEKNILIEYDGEQHFVNTFEDNKLEVQQKHDLMKFEYCKNNKINLIRIPFWEKKNIENILETYFKTSNLNIKDKYIYRKKELSKLESYIIELNI